MHEKEAMQNFANAKGTAKGAQYFDKETEKKRLCNVKGKHAK